MKLFVILSESVDGKQDYGVHFMDGVQLLLVNHFEEAVYFFPQVFRNSWYSFSQPQKDERLSWSRSHSGYCFIKLVNVFAAWKDLKFQNPITPANDNFSRLLLDLPKIKLSCSY